MKRLPNPSSKFQILEFDTKLFGFKVARILAPKLTLAKLHLILKTLKKQQVRLVYWPAASSDKTSQIAARKLQGFLSSEQRTYLISLKTAGLPKTFREVKLYRANTTTIAMQRLAIQIGARSRFGTDPRMPRKLFHKLYRAWIKNSVNGTAADRVLVTSNKRKITGLITLSSKNDRGDIRLVAVDPQYQGKQLGTKLVETALNHLFKKGHRKAQVVTQKSNLPACRLYEKCGFRLETTDNFYHFWL